MLTAEEFTVDSFVEVLRGLSLKGRQGVLHVCCDDMNVHVEFSDGFVCSAWREDESTVQCVCDRLWRAGIIDEELCEYATETHESLEELYRDLIARDRSCEDALRRAIAARYYDVLHGLGSAERKQMQFTPRVVRPSPLASLRVPPGQLLLDFVESAQLHARFREMLQERSASELEVARAGHLNQHVLQGDSVLWECLVQPVTISQLWEKSLLSHFQFVESLVSLWEHGLVTLGGKENHSKTGGAVPAAHILFETQGKGATPHLPKLHGDRVSSPGNSGSALFCSEAMEEETETTSHDSKRFIIAEDSQKPEIQPSVLQPAKQQYSIQRDQSSISDAERNQNDGSSLLLRFASSPDRLAFTVALLFLLGTALLLPTLLSEFFSALEKFSSLP